MHGQPIIKIIISCFGNPQLWVVHCAVTPSLTNLDHNPLYISSMYIILLLLLPLALQRAVGFVLSNIVPPFCPVCHQLSPSFHSQHLKISFYFFSPSFPGLSPSFRPFQLLSEDLFGHPILLQVTQPIYPLPLYPLYCIFSFTHLL
jgi:hypothetical protein